MIVRLSAFGFGCRLRKFGSFLISASRRKRQVCSHASRRSVAKAQNAGGPLRGLNGMTAKVHLWWSGPKNAIRSRARSVARIW